MRIPELEPSSNARAERAAGRQTGDTPPSPRARGRGRGRCHRRAHFILSGLRARRWRQRATPIRGGRERRERASETRDASESRRKVAVARRKVHFESSAARVLLGFAGGDFRAVRDDGAGHEPARTRSPRATACARGSGRRNPGCAAAAA